MSFHQLLVGQFFNDFPANRRCNKNEIHFFWVSVPLGFFNVFLLTSSFNWKTVSWISSGILYDCIWLLSFSPLFSHLYHFLIFNVLLPLTTMFLAICHCIPICTSSNKALATKSMVIFYELELHREKWLPFHISVKLALHIQIYTQNLCTFRYTHKTNKKNKMKTKTSEMRVHLVQNGRNLCELLLLFAYLSFFFCVFADAVIKSTPFFLISGLILVVSYMVLMLAMCSQRHSVLFFFSGIFFIIAGLWWWWLHFARTS